MAGSKIQGNARTRAIYAVLPLLLSCLSGPALADEPKLSALAPPEEALRLTPAPDGRVLLQLDVTGKKLGDTVKLTLHSFWDADGKAFEVTLEDPNAETPPIPMKRARPRAQPSPSRSESASRSC